jgi:hypothetical protein
MDILVDKLQIAICVAAISTLLPAHLLAQDPRGFPAVRQPVGIYVRDTDDCTPSTYQCMHDKAASLLANPAIAGINPELDWVDLNPEPGNYDWTELRAIFDATDEWNAANSGMPRKTVQLDVNPGFNSPPWVFGFMTSCDPMFGSGTPGTSTYMKYPKPKPWLVARDCGYATYPEVEDKTIPTPYATLPLPWNPVYKFAWAIFVHALAQEYGSNPDLVSIAIAGPTASSAEMILPNEKKDAADFYKWNYLFALTLPASYQNSDRIFIEEWQHAIDLYSYEFSGLTLAITTGNGLPNFPGTNYQIPPGFEPVCQDSSTSSTEPYGTLMDCAAETSVVAYLADPLHGGWNLKSIQENGMAAGGITHQPLGGGNLGSYGIRWLAAISANGITRLPGSNTWVSRVLGGSQSGGTLNPTTDDLQSQGCNKPGMLVCHHLSEPQAYYNFMASYFDGTPVAGYYGPGYTGEQFGFDYGAGIVAGNVPLNYLQLYDIDVMYATEYACPPLAGSCSQSKVESGDGTYLLTSAQAVIEKAAAQIQQIAEPPPRKGLGFFPW